MPDETRQNEAGETYIPRRLLLAWLGGFALCAVSFGLAGMARQACCLLVAGCVTLPPWIAGLALVLAMSLRVAMPLLGRLVLFLGSLAAYMILSTALYALAYG